MGYITKESPALDIQRNFTNYCLTYGFNKTNCPQLTTDTVYDILYECWIRRTKTKRDTYESFEFEYNAGEELERIAAQVARLEWQPSGYRQILIHHPDRCINAPRYPDRIVEQWITEEYIIPFWIDRLIPENLAGQEGKGPYKAIELIRSVLLSCHEKYGSDFWFFQGDMQGYYDNISHTYVKKINQGMNPYGYFLLCNIIDSWEEPDCYALKNDSSKVYGFPKGNLPSQWVGITALDGLDHAMANNPDCKLYLRYADDFIAFFHTKKMCRDCREFVERYLQNEGIGVMLHPRKTAYAPISRGFNFCGWHYRMRDDGSAEVKVRQDRKRLKKQELCTKQKAYGKGREAWSDISNSMQGTFAHYKHGDTKSLRKYMCNRYHFRKDDMQKTIKKEDFSHEEKKQTKQKV